MLDLLMLGILGACVGLIALLVRWCRKQLDSEQ